MPNFWGATSSCRIVLVVFLPVGVSLFMVEPILSPFCRIPDDMFCNVVVRLFVADSQSRYSLYNNQQTAVGIYLLLCAIHYSTMPTPDNRTSSLFYAASFFPLGIIVWPTGLATTSDAS
jgi:hypothetical protein